MDDKKTVNELKEIVRDFCDERDWKQFHNPKDLAIGISTEASELLDIFRFKSDKQIEEIMNGDKKNKVCDEVADVLYFILRFAELNDIDLSTELKRKIQHSAEKYPVNKVRGNNKKYNEYED